MRLSFLKPLSMSGARGKMGLVYRQERLHDSLALVTGESHVQKAQPNGLIRFGVFEVDPQSGERRRKGFRVKLQDQPVQILLAVLEEPGPGCHSRGTPRKALACGHICGF